MTTDATLAAYLAELRQEVDAGLERVLASLAAPALITDAMRYSLMAGGKRLRPCPRSPPPRRRAPARE